MAFDKSRLHLDLESAAFWDSRRREVVSVQCCEFAAPRPGYRGERSYDCALHGSTYLRHTPEQEVEFVASVIHAMSPEARTILVQQFVHAANNVGLMMVSQSVLSDSVLEHVEIEVPEFVQDSTTRQDGEDA
jgi:hypothetical protein